MTYNDSSIVLALDYGNQRVGVALGNGIARMANPLTVLLNDESLLSSVTDIVGKEHVSQIVVGLPRNMDGSLGAQAEKTTAFASELRSQVSVPVELHEETLSTVEAAELFPGVAIDAAAAAVILERFFNEGGQRKETA